MKKTTQPFNVLMQKFSRVFAPAVLDQLAHQSGFIQRRPRKLTALTFVLSFFNCLSTGSSSLNEWAAHLHAFTGECLSKQGLHCRLGKPAAEFCRRLLDYVLKRCVATTRELQRTIGSFSRVLLQDSTTFGLHDHLQSHFRGNTAGGIKKAVVRLKTIIDLCPPCSWCTWASPRFVTMTRARPLTSILFYERACWCFATWVTFR
jgi:hypothetical protein